MTDKKTEALELALVKIRAAQMCHPNAVMVLIDEAEEVLAEALADIGNPITEQPAIPTVITCPFCSSEHVPGWLHDLNMDRGAYGKQPAIKQDLTPEQHQCKFPMCHNEEYRQALAEQIKRELYTGEPALKFTDKMSIDVPVQFLFQKQPAPVAEPRKPQEPVDKRCSPCPEFWDWLPRAYNFEGLGNFTKYNMEVAFLAGMQSTHLPAQPQQEPLFKPLIDSLPGLAEELKAMDVAQQQQDPVYFCDYGYESWGKVDAAMAAANLADGMTVEAYYTSPPANKPWVGLTDDEIEEGLLRSNYAFVTALAWRQGVEWAEAKLKEKNSD